MRGLFDDLDIRSELATRLEFADAVVFFDLPRAACFWGVFKRNGRYFGRSRPEMPVGCPERADLEFIQWIWRWPTTSRLRLLKLLDAADASTEIVTVRRRGEAQALLDRAAGNLAAV